MESGSILPKRDLRPRRLIILGGICMRYGSAFRTSKETTKFKIRHKMWKVCYSNVIKYSINPHNESMHRVWNKMSSFSSPRFSVLACVKGLRRVNTVTSANLPRKYIALMSMNRLPWINPSMLVGPSLFGTLEEATQTSMDLCLGSGGKDQMPPTLTAKKWETGYKICWTICLALTAVTSTIDILGGSGPLTWRERKSQQIWTQSSTTNSSGNKYVRQSCFRDSISNCCEDAVKIQDGGFPRKNRLFSANARQLTARKVTIYALDIRHNICI